MPSQAAFPNAAAPTAAKDRIGAIDIVRGVALYGVMAINVVTEFRVSLFQQFLPSAPDTSGINRLVDSFLQCALDMKAFSLFSLLFGVGLAIQYERLARVGTPFRWLRRRLLVLLAFGLIHLLLVWNGDILTEYALAGFVILLFLAGPRWLLALASVSFLTFYAAMPLLHLPIPWPSQDWFYRHVADANAAYEHGSFIAAWRFSFYEVANIVPLHLFVFPRTVGLMLFGAFTWRLGIPQSPAGHKPAIACTAILGILAGGLLTASDFMGWIGPRSALAPLTDTVAKMAPPVLAIGYAAAILWLVAFTPVRKLLRVFGPIGRMAFTNYIAESVIFSALFYGYGLGFYGRTGSAAALLLGTCVYALQMFVSAWWLRRCRFGPLEWLWRSLMYGKSQPMLVNQMPHVATGF